MKSPTIDTTRSNHQTDDLANHSVVAEGLTVEEVTSETEVTAIEVNEPIEEITCVKCETTKSWGGGSWCPSCGYYPAGNKFINLEVMGESPSENESDTPENLWQAIPRWVHELLAGVMVIAGVSFVATIFQEAGSPIRSWWAVIQAVIGFGAFFVIHIRVFLIATVHSEKLNPVSWLTEPVEIWKPIFKEPLQYKNYIRIAAWGQAAAFFAIVFIGGLSYEGLFADWGVRGYADTTLVEAIKNKDKQSEKALEEKLKMLEAGTLYRDPSIKRPPSRFNADCVVIGFTKNSKGGFKELLLASTNGSKLQFVGRLTAGDLTEVEQQEVNMLIKNTPQQNNSIVKTVHSGIWLKPQMMLKVGYDELNSKSNFKKIQFQSLLRSEI